MPQPRSRSGRGSSSDAERPAEAPRTVADALARGLLLSVERIREATDDAVRRGRLTRDDAEQLVQALVEAGRRQTDELRAELEQLVGRSRGAAGGVHREARRRLAQGGDRARRAAGLDGVPIAGYDELTAAQITARLAELDPAQLRRVRDYERRHANRKSVLAVVERRLP